MKGKGYGWTQEDNDREMKISADCKYSPTVSLGAITQKDRAKQCYPIFVKQQVLPEPSIVATFGGLIVRPSTTPGTLIAGYPRELKPGVNVD